MNRKWLEQEVCSSEFLVEVVELQHGEKRWARLRIVPGDFNHVELALDPFCTFRFRVIATNAIGTSAASQPTEKRHTPPAGERSAVVQLLVTGVFALQMLSKE